MLKSLAKLRTFKVSLKSCFKVFYQAFQLRGVFLGSKYFSDIFFNNLNCLFLPDWTDDDIVAQCMIFFLGGYSSISSTACFMFHELSLNPDIQAKLFKEIQSVKAELNGSPLTYDSIEKLKYLDMVVCETLRRWSPIPFIERTCNLPYVLENGDGKKVTINIGDEVLIPIFGLHMDDKYFSNPDKFDPERFSDENKDSIQSGTYLPFGIGPSKCFPLLNGIKNY